MVNKRSSISESQLLKLIDPDDLDEQEAKVIIERTANDLDQLKRLSSPHPIHLYMQIQPFFRREPISTRPSYMALPIRPIYQP